MQKVIARIKLDDSVETVEGGLKSYDETSLVLVLPQGGEATYPKNDVEDLNITDQVFELSQVAPVTEEPKAKKEKTKVEGTELKPLKEGSKLAQVVEICKANPNATRKEVIALIVEATGMSAAGASTYHQNAKAYL